MDCTKALAIRCLTYLTISVGLGGAPSHSMAQKTCSIDMEKRADSSLVDLSDSWPSLLRHQRSFASCDDGALAEGYSDAVVTLFANRWDQFGVFVALSKRHPAFRRWAIRHIDASASSDDLKKIVLNAATCIGDVPTKALCKKARRAAEQALTELTQLQQN